MTDRREFLKLFGVGCAVVPIIGGAPVAAAESRLIEIPKLIPVEQPSMAGSADGVRFMSGPLGITVTLDDPSDGKRVTLHGKTFVMSIQNEIGDCRSWHDRVPFAQIVKKQIATWRMEGQLLPDEDGNIYTQTMEIMR